MERWTWTQVADMGPSGRAYPAMAYDEARDRVILYGGGVTGAQGTMAALSDTWEWDGESWVQVEDSGPSGRWGSAMTYDAARQRILLFGGSSKNKSTLVPLGDTWEWDGKFWSQLDDTGPPPGAGTMAGDATHGYLLLYLGATTWAWNGATWSELTEAGPGDEGVAAYDGNRGQIVLCVRQRNEKPSTTWTWDGAAWKPISDMGPSLPSALFGAAAFDGKRLVLFQSWDCQTWEWGGARWTQRQDIGPSHRIGAGLVGDTARNRCVLFGGRLPNTVDVFGDTWALSVVSTSA